MIVRSLRILSQPFVRNRCNVKPLQLARNKWLYRDYTMEAPRWDCMIADVLSTTMWWWIFIHLYYQSGHVLGEYDYPEPDKWTDAELGVVDVD